MIDVKHMAKKPERHNKPFTSVWFCVLQQYLGLWPVGIEDVGVVCAIHHLAAGFMVFVTTAV